MQWRIQLLGELCLTGSGHRITRFRSQKIAGILAYLAYPRVASAISRESLIDRFWPESEIEAGQVNLRAALASLRRQLEPPGVEPGTVLIADRYSVQLNPTAIASDVAEFQNTLHAAAKARNQTRQAEHLASALSLYCGPLLPNLYDDWILIEQQRLQEQYLAALQAWVTFQEQEGRPEEALARVRHALELYPTEEEFYLLLMRLLAGCGEFEAALRQYEALAQILAREFQTDPSAAASALAARIRRRMITPDDPALHRVGTETASGLSSASKIPTGMVASLGVSTGADAGTIAAICERIEAVSGFVFPPDGKAADAAKQVFAVFAHISNALQAARSIAQTISPIGPLAVHITEAHFRNGRYTDAVFVETERLLMVGHPGQILCSEAAAALLSKSATSPSLRDLGRYQIEDGRPAARIFQIAVSEDRNGGQSEVFPSLRATPERTGNLPISATRFFGRATEIARLQAYLLAPEVRLLTLTGPGGIGKTRLALEAARALQSQSLPHMPFEAVWFVPLAELLDAPQITENICRALEAPPSAQGDFFPQLVAFLSRQTTLLILDNFEHLVEEGADQVIQLLEQVPELTCLTTSRLRLNLEGEQVFEVAPLALSAGANTPEGLAQSAAAQLFVDRAQRVRPDFQLTAQNAPTIAELCDRLEGIPLALELAAARIAVLTPRQMLDQLSERFQLLVGKTRGRSARHQTLRAAVAWSYHLLPPELQRLFARLSVFRGGWTVEDAAAICEQPDTLEALSRLRECSLLTTTEVSLEEDEPTMRFQMLETLREFGAEQLDSEAGEELARRHTEHFLTFAQEAAPHLLGPDQVVWLRRMEQEHDNFCACLRWALNTKQTMLALRLGAAYYRFWEVRGYMTPGRRWLEAILALPEGAGQTALRARLLNGQGCLAQMQGDFEASKQALSASLHLAEQAPDEFAPLQPRNNLALTYFYEGYSIPAIALLQQCLEDLRNGSGSQSQIASVLNNLGMAATQGGEMERAERDLLEALRLYRELGNLRGIAKALTNLASLTGLRGELARSAGFLLESLTLHRQLGDSWGMGLCLRSAAMLADAANQPKLAAWFTGMALQQWNSTQTPAGLGAEGYYQELLARLYTALGKEAFDAEQSAGRLASLDDGVAALTALGRSCSSLE